jgi:hypothetical protein
MRDIKESYGRIGDNEDRFDLEFWQWQGDQAIFKAALDMILDYLMIRHGHVDKPRLHRTVESFGKMDLTTADRPGRKLRKGLPRSGFVPRAKAERPKLVLRRTGRRVA